MSIHLFKTPFIESTDEKLSLKEAFSTGAKNLSSEGLDRIVIMKLLLAVAHAALRDQLKSKSQRQRINSEDLCRTSLDRNPAANF